MDVYRYHPIIVHFPIVLLLGATVLLALLMARRPVEKLTSWVMALGCFSAWLAVYTGGLAEDQAEHVWHVPTAAIEAHERGGQITLVLFIISYLALTLGWRFRQRLLYTLAMLVALVGSGFLIYTGDKGGDIVYKHALPATASDTGDRPHH